MVSVRLIALAALGLGQANASSRCQLRPSGHQFSSSTHLVSSATGIIAYGSTVSGSSTASETSTVLGSSTVKGSLTSSGSALASTASDISASQSTAAESGAATDSVATSGSISTSHSTQTGAATDSTSATGSQSATTSGTISSSLLASTQSSATSTSTFTPSTSMCGDQCAHDVAAVDQNQISSAAYLATCNYWLATTSRPAPVVVSTTTTVTSTMTDGESTPTASEDLATEGLTLRRRIQTVTSLPPFASMCDDDVAFTSACECFGATVSTVIASAETTTVTATETSWYTIEGDSPPFTPTESVVLPTDPSWTSSYTPDVGVPLPTFSPYDDAIVFPTPTDSPACAIDPSETGIEYYVADANLGFLVNEGGKPVPTQPSGQAEASALAQSAQDPTALPYPVYKFEQPSGAEEGLYDLVLVGDKGKQYIALGEGNQVVFTSASTNGVLSNKLITTIFQISCDGGISIKFNDHVWSWSGTTSGTELVVGQGSIILTSKQSLIDGMKAVQEAAQTSTPGTSPVERRSQWNSGLWPRCPGAQEDVYAYLKPGARGNNPDGCGSTSFKVPDWGFKSCCDTHDNCYDDCNRTFNGCNGDFWGCMLGVCRGYLNSFWTSWKAPLCVLGANSYAAAVQVGAKGAFYASNSDRCKCSCPAINGMKQNYCPDRCIITGGNDNNNCGGCNYKCPYKTHCNKGSCACDNDRCGNLCVNFQTNPNNCGRCGNKCSSGFCYQGQCWDVPPVSDTCIPVQGAQNNWGFQTVTGVASQQGNVMTIGAVNTQAVFLLSNDVSFPGFGFGGLKSRALWSNINLLVGAATMSQDVKVCPGTQYELDFKVKGLITNGCSFRVTLGSIVLVNIGLSTDWAGTVFVPKTYGPFGFTLNEGDPLTTKQGLSLQTQLKFESACLSGSGSFLFKDVSVHAA